MSADRSSRGTRVITLPFALAVVMLGAAAILAGPVASRLKLKLVKEPLPLKEPLSALNAASLYPYRVVQKRVLEPVVVEELGTRDYITWLLEDTSVSESDPLRYANLFVTYYTGGSNLVPHTPDVCFLGTGYNPAQPHDNTEVTISTLGPEHRNLPVRLCTFIKSALFNRTKVSVVYTFFTNGHFANTRTGVRITINNPTDTYAFFSKVEISFPRATRAQCLRGAEKLLNRVLPVLIRDHWPDFEAAEAAAASGAVAES